MVYGATVTYDNGAEQLVFRRDGDFWLTVAPDLSSVQVDIAEAQTAGQAGSSITAQQVLPKTIVFTGSIMRNIADSRAKLLRVVAPGRNATITYSTGSESYAITGVPTRTPMIGAGVAVQDFQFSFYAPCPYWRDIRESCIDIAGLEPVFRFPFNTGGKWYISQFTNGFYQNAPNRGNVPVEMEVCIYARSRVVNPRLMHMDKGTVLKVQRTLAAGQRFIICTRLGERGAFLIDSDGSRRNGFASLSVDSDLAMALEPGDNQLYFSADEGREGARVTVTAPRALVSGV